LLNKRASNKSLQNQKKLEIWTTSNTVTDVKKVDNLDDFLVNHKEF